MEDITRRRYFLLAGVTLSVSILLGIVVMEGVLRWAGSTADSGGQLDDGLFEYDARLGWVVSRDWRGGHVHGDYSVTYATNGFGHRGKPVTTAKQPGEKRYAYLGDSFTFGMGVNNAETFTEILASRGKAEHLNFGVPGYSTDQEVLYLEEKVMRFQPDVVVLIVYLANDLIDNLGPYPLQVDFAKPYFALDNGSLAIRNTPVPREPKPAVLRSRSFSSVVLKGVEIKQSLLARSEVLRRLGYRDKAGDISAMLADSTKPSIDLFDALIQRLDDRVRSVNAKLIVALLPGRSFVHEPDGYSAQYQDHIRDLINKRLKQAGIGSLDIGDELRRRFENGDTDLYFPYDGHLTANGHRVMADLLEHNLP
ncbi:MAG: SGNH/GDSL hydrolase family protein [Pseudomonadota bacterium]